MRQSPPQTWEPALMAQPISERERYRLLSAWCDGSITDVQLALLDELLRTDHDFRRLYLAYMDQHALLVTELRPIEEAQPALRLAEHEPPGRAVRRGRSWTVLVMGTAAVAAILLGGLAVWYWPHGQRDTPIVADGTTNGAPTRVVPADANGCAVVIQLAGVEWEHSIARPPSEGDTLPPGRLVFRAGRMTLGLLSGVTLTVEGPADLELLAIDRVHCRRGRLRTRVPDGAEGFVVSAPSAAVVDLGTEFALNVAEDGTARLMVFEGAAEAAVFNPAGSPRRLQRIRQDQAFDIDPRSAQIEAAPPRGEDFLSPPVLAIPPLTLDSSYREVVLAAQPWGYWRFETMDGGAVPSEVAGCPPLRAGGPVRLASADALAPAHAPNRCAEFGPEETDQTLSLDGLWEPPTQPGYAVELWMLPERIGHAALVSLIDPDLPNDDYKHLFLLELTASDRQSLLPPGAVRFLHRWPPSDSGGENLFSGRFYVPYRWHHLVAQNNHGRVELYVNGSPTAPSVALGADMATEPCRLLLGRLKPEPRHPGKIHSRPFVGRIDELVLYDHPLAAEEIARHYRLGTPAGAGGGASIKP
jgi:hypothetical protein